MLGFALPDALRNGFASQERVSLELQGQIWESFCTQADDPLVGVQFGLAMEVGHLDTAGMVLMSCETVRDALDSLIDYYPIVGEGGHFQYHEDADRCIIHYLPQYQTRQAERVEAAMATLLQLSRWTTGNKLAAHSLHFTHAALDDNRRYESLLGLSDVRFLCDHNPLIIPVTDLDLPLIYANPALCQHLRTLADQLLQSLGDQSLSAQVTEQLRQHPHWGKEKVADTLGMSGRHLVRKLGEEGGGRDAGARFIDALEMIKRLVNIGDAKSLACHPATTTHRQLSDDELKSAGVSADLVRLSVGIEHIDDILADITQALEKA